jgi:hypothetical protein
MQPWHHAYTMTYNKKKFPTFIIVKIQGILFIYNESEIIAYIFFKNILKW